MGNLVIKNGLVVDVIDVNKVKWYYISIYQKLSEPFIDKFKDKVDWYYISIFQKLSEEFIVKYQDKIEDKRKRYNSIKCIDIKFIKNHKACEKGFKQFYKIFKNKKITYNEFVDRYNRDNETTSDVSWVYNNLK
jgi:hypothetical protein